MDGSQRMHYLVTWNLDVSPAGKVSGPLGGSEDAGNEILSCQYSRQRRLLESGIH